MKRSSTRRPATAHAAPHAGWRLGARLLSAVMLGLVVAWPGGASAQTRGTPLSIDPITGSPNAYAGQTVTVQGQINDIGAPRAFTIDHGGWSANDILVVGAPGVGPSGRRWGEDDRVQVTGTVRIFQRDAYHRQAGAQVDDDTLQNWDGRPVLFARSVEIVQD